MARGVAVKSSGDCFCHDAVNGCTWAYAAASGRLERWTTLPPPRRPPLPSPSSPSLSPLSPFAAAGRLLRHLDCLSTSPALISLCLQATFHAVKRIFASPALRESATAVDGLRLLLSTVRR